MNKADLVAELSRRLDGDHALASAAVENTIDIIVRAVAAGESLTIMGFGIFERRSRAARVGRNIRTGESLEVAPTITPVFRPAQYFKSVVQGTVDLPAEGLAVRRGSSHGSFGDTAD